MKKVTLLQLLVVAITFSFSFGQNATKGDDYFTDNSAYTTNGESVQYINTTKSRKIVVNLEGLKQNLINAQHRNTPNAGTSVYVYIPNPDGGQARYEVLENTTMAEGLKREFLGIRSYDVVSAENPDVHGKIDFTHQGFHAMITSPEDGKFFIDPVYMGNSEYHMVYWKKDFYTDKTAECEFAGNANVEDLEPTNTNRAFGTCELRTYRLALCATAEYTAFHGGLANAISAQVTTMNRVNEIYERDMAVTMTIVANNSTIVYTNSGTDPFTNGSAGNMIGECQSTCDSQIGSGNYDIGHVFGTNSGGLAGFGVVCSNGAKARGVTGSGAPIGDSFDIDYVAHEMGHQFGCSHTFNNSCGGNRSDTYAVEPGSGSTIMAYAGICSPNVQNNSDDHFHGISLEQMGNLLTGTSCAVVTGLANNPPIITATPTNFYVPANTPFALTATASDPDGNTLLYCWEQMDNGISTQAPVPTSTVGPNYRSNSPNTSPTRYFPNLNAVNSGNLTPTWEVTPSVSRAFSFRVTVRDQASGGACNDHADITMNTDGTAGPFVLTYPSASGITWGGLMNETITWNVANTDNVNVNCQFVDIFLSLDGGLTYPTQIADDVANNGSYGITVPNTPSTSCRIMVMAQNGTFFDVSNNNFTITAATNDFTLSVATPSQTICQPDDATYTVDIGNIGGFNNATTLSVTGLPAGASAAFSTNPVTPAGTSVLTISGSGSVTPGSYSVTLEATSTTGTKTTNLTYVVTTNAIATVTLAYPTDTQTGVGLPVNFQWSDAGVGSLYDLEVATDAGFATIVSSQTGLTTNSFIETGLAGGTIHYWRVTAYNNCSNAPVSSTFSFESGTCNTYASTDVPVTISASGTPTVTSTLNVVGSGTILDLDVVDLIGTHSWINDLTITITSPSNTTVTLFANVCDPQNPIADFDLNFDDGAPAGALPCPPVGGGTYQPSSPLSAFNGETAAGTWTLTIVDAFNQDGGALSSWGLMICLGVCNAADVPTISATANTVCSGDLTTLSVASGNLNDATDWSWYSASCTGTLLGTGTSINVNPTTATNYYAKGTGSCTGTAGSCGTIAIGVNPAYNENVNVSICNGDNFTYPDGTVSNNVTSSESHVSSLNSGLNCDSIITTNLNVVTLSGGVTVSTTGVYSSAQSGSATYVWVDCDNGNAPIPGETSQTFTPAINGNYGLILTSTINNSCSITSSCTLIGNVGLDENEVNSFTIFPNPSNGNYKIVFSNSNSYNNLEIVDGRGRLVYKKKLQGELDLDVNLTNESEGIYIMRLSNDEDLKIIKLIKQ